MLTQDEIKQLREVIREENSALETRMEKKIEASQKEIIKKIDVSQEDTIKVLTDVINEGYNDHENRLKTVENILQIDKN